MFRHIDINLRLVKYNSGYQIQCPLYKGCDPTLVGSMELFQHLRAVHNKDRRKALNKLEHMLKNLEKRYL
ncbi:MAG: hypothetical protein ACHQYP_09200, partial [Nitrospiria bacterium]